MTKQCAMCGNEFETEFHLTKYCSQDCKKKASNIQMKQHREKYPERNRERSRKWYSENKERAKENARKYYSEHKEEISAYNRAYYYSHKKELNERCRLRYWEKKIKACREAHDNCLSCDTPDGECRFD